MRLVSKFIFSIMLTAGFVFSFVNTDNAFAADAETSINFKGLVQVWYDSSSSKEKSGADSVSESKFLASSRLGATGTTVQGEWTANAVLEIEAHSSDTPGVVSTTARDCYISVDNGKIGLSLGRQDMPSFGGNNTFSAINSNEDTVGGLGRTEGAVLSIDNIPNASIKLIYSDVADGANDVTAYQPYISYSLSDNLTIGANFTSSSSVENEDKFIEDEDRNGNSDNSVDSNSFALFGIAEFGELAPYVGYESFSTTTSSVGADDVDSSVSKLLIGFDYGLGDDLGIYAEYTSLVETPDEGDDVATSIISLAVSKTIAQATVQLGYFSDSVSAGDDESQDGAKSDSVIAGITYGF